MTTKPTDFMYTNNFLVSDVYDKDWQPTEKLRKILEESGVTNFSRDTIIGSPLRYKYNLSKLCAAPEFAQYRDKVKGVKQVSSLYVNTTFEMKAFTRDPEHILNLYGRPGFKEEIDMCHLTRGKTFRVYAGRNYIDQPRTAYTQVLSLLPFFKQNNHYMYYHYDVENAFG